ncbi:MAG TPA: folate-binding protein YgfZ [Methylophilaceae bacterium]|nr:folate-binding protein YgfZ [Methylophilaceae bacterium]
MTQWHTFLKSQGAVLGGSQVANFGDAQAELQATASGNMLADLSHLGLLQISGEDAVSFLQGQVTNDIKLLNGHNSQYAGYCNPKGRLLALFLAFVHHNHLYLQLHGTLLEPIMKRLKMYVMRSKVTIVDVSANTLCIGVAGKDTEASLRAIFGKVPNQVHELVSLDNAALLRMPGAAPRYLIFSDAKYAPTIWEQLQKTHKSVGKACWDWLEIQAGIPEISPETQEEFVPQMINLDALDGINYKKCCYTGQEIVARMHYLGKIKRRTQLAHIATNEQPQAGDDVFSTGSNEPVGKMVRSAPSPQGGFDVLAEIRLESLETGTMHLKPADGPALELLKLPYAL